MGVDSVGHRPLRALGRGGKATPSSPKGHQNTGTTSARAAYPRRADTFPVHYHRKASPGPTSSLVSACAAARRVDRTAARREPKPPRRLVRLTLFIFPLRLVVYCVFLPTLVINSTRPFCRPSQRDPGADGGRYLVYIPYFRIGCREQPYFRNINCTPQHTGTKTVTRTGRNNTHTRRARLITVQI